jgi:hypothetical protein
VEIWESGEWGRCLLQDTPPHAVDGGQGGACSELCGSGSKRGGVGVGSMSALKSFGPSGSVNAEFVTPSGPRAAGSRKGSATDAPRVLFA